MTASNESPGGVGAWIGRNILLLMGLVALAVTIVVYVVTVGPHEGHLAAQGQRIAQLEAQVSQAEADVTAAERDAVRQVTGLDMARAADDAKTAERLMRAAATWSSGPQYIEARQTVLSAWDLAPDSQFMTVFMPGEEQGAYRTDPAGNIHFAYPDANSQLIAFEQTLVGADSDEWRYLGLAQIRVTSQASGSVTRPIAVTYSTSPDGAITEVSAYPSNKAPVVSGKG